MTKSKPPLRVEPSLVLFGDPLGLPRLLRHAPASSSVRALVRSSIRPAQERELDALAQRAGLPLLTQPRVGAPGYDAFVEHLRTLAPEFLVVDNYSMRLGRRCSPPRVGEP